MRSIKFLDLPAILILCKLVLSLSVDIAGYILPAHISNALLFNLYQLVDLWLLGTVAYLLLNKSKLFVIVSVMMSTIISIYFLYIDLDSHFNNIGFLVESVVLTILYLIIITQELMSIKTQKKSVIWVCIAIIIYYGCCVPFFSLINYLRSDIANDLYLINSFLNIIFYLLIGYAFYLSRRIKLLKANDR